MVGNIIQKFLRKRSKTVVSRILPYIRGSKKLVDIGSGTGDVAFLLKKTGYDITAVDVADFHGPRIIKPVIYDGSKLPFSDKSFDTALLLMVLHHTPNPELIFDEAARVAKEIVLIETSYSTPINRWFTIVSDAVGNLRTKAFWPSYKSDEEWKRMFNNKKFEVLSSAKYWDTNFGLPFLHIAYHLRKK